MNKITHYTLLIILALAINLASIRIVAMTGFPLFLDTWGTMLGVILGGIPVGLAGSIAYNLIMAGTSWGWSGWVWVFSSVWITLASAFLIHHGFLSRKHPLRILLGGLLLGFTNGLITFLISATVFQSLANYQPTIFINEFFLTMIGGTDVAAFLEHMTVELIDKTISLFLAVYVASIIPPLYSRVQKQFVPRHVKQKE